ncbi:hypothetical protein FCM35_KLT01667 [Carex littledalei]|uniref:Uncharacterized protein n=1 Tax=Carex littledalei TaxID=544730 RepID=A0A833R6F8_9POAL|nr:hypothetical protein FCM35_KLT01667 [Carex littledalei]
MGLQNRVIRVRFTDPDATDSDTHSDVCQTAGQQHQSCQKAAQPKQAVTQQCKFCLTSDEMCRYCQMPGMKAKGAAADPDATDSDTHSDVCQTAGQQHQWCQKAAQPKQAVTQQCKFCLTSDEMCRYCQMPGMKAKGAVAVQIKKRKEVEKEVTLVVSPLVQKRKRIKIASRPPVHPQSFVSKEKQREDNPTMDIVCEANKSKSSVTSAAHITTGSTSSVHNTSTKPPGFWEDLSSQLLKQMEALTDADLQTGDFDSENDLIQLDHLPVWAGNLNWDDYPFFK